MKYLFILVFIISASVLYSQSNSEKAYELGMEAIELMDNGQIEKSIELLEKAQQLDPTNMNYSYEMAYAHNLSGNYSEAMKILKKLLKHPDVTDQVYQMLGNLYDITGNPKKAIKTYESGLKLFPNSGNLYLERGTMEAMQNKLGEAVYYYEKGIEVDPAFPSNYYWASRIYFLSDNKVWGMIYGEIFMNMERNTKRTADISKLLFDCYKENIVIEDSTTTVDLCSNQIFIDVKNMSADDFKMPYCVSYSLDYTMGIIDTKDINLNSLDTIRGEFIEQYFSKGHNEEYPNVLFDYMKTMKDAGWLTYYNHWILMKGDEEAFDKWLEGKESLWERFVQWFLEYPLEITDEHNFHRTDY